METIQFLIHFVLHIDAYLVFFVTNYGTLTYLLLFAVLFCETGLVVVPFLPGDSLLFTAGSLAANTHNSLKIQALFILLTLASILGNKLNYTLGRILGPKVFSAPQSWLLNKKHLEEAHRFYLKHGGKTIILGRFIPIIRSFVPFVAGIGRMNLRQFSFYNVFSAVLWVGGLLGAGYYFGSFPFIKENFSLVIYSIIALSLLPLLIGFIYRKPASSTQQKKTTSC